MSNTLHFIADLRFIYTVLQYPNLQQIVQFLLKTVPTFEKVGVEHEAFVSKKAEKRMRLKTVRKDFMYYVSVPRIKVLGVVSSLMPHRLCAIMTRRNV